MVLCLDVASLPLRCDIDAGEILSLTISSAKTTFMLEMSPGNESQAFVGEIFRQMEGKSKEESTDASWLQEILSVIGKQLFCQSSETPSYNL